MRTLEFFLKVSVPTIALHDRLTRVPAGKTAKRLNISLDVCIGSKMGVTVMFGWHSL